MHNALARAQPDIVCAFPAITETQVLVEIASATLATHRFSCFENAFREYKIILFLKLHYISLKSDTITVKIVMPGAVTFPVPFVSDLLDSHSETFRKAKLSIEAILLKAFIFVLSKTPTAVEVISFSYFKINSQLTLYCLSILC